MAWQGLKNSVSSLISGPWLMDMSGGDDGGPIVPTTAPVGQPPITGPPPVPTTAKQKRHDKASSAPAPAPAPAPAAKSATEEEKTTAKGRLGRRVQEKGQRRLAVKQTREVVQASRGALKTDQKGQVRTRSGRKVTDQQLKQMAKNPGQIEKVAQAVENNYKYDDEADNKAIMGMVGLGAAVPGVAALLQNPLLESAPTSTALTLPGHFVTQGVTNITGSELATNLRSAVGYDTGPMMTPVQTGTDLVPASYKFAGDALDVAAKGGMGVAGTMGAAALTLAGGVAAVKVIHRLMGTGGYKSQADKDEMLAAELEDSLTARNTTGEPIQRLSSYKYKDPDAGAVFERPPLAKRMVEARRLIQRKTQTPGQRRVQSRNG